MTSLGFGVIGCGNFGGEFARILNGLEGTRTVAVVGGADDSAKLLSEELQCATAASVEALVARDDVDAVIVASPNHLHKQHVILAAQHGKHVFCEKPIALSLADCEDMIAACRRASVHMMAGHILHFMSGVQQVKRLIEQGAIGKPIVSHAERTGWQDKQAGSSWKQNPAQTGGYLFHFIHELDLVQTLLGPAASVVLAGSWIDPALHASSNPDHLLLTMEFSNGALGTMQYGSGFRQGGHFVKINGTEGAVFVNFKRSEIVVKSGNHITSFGINGSPDEDEDRVHDYRRAEGKVVFTSPQTRPPLFLRKPMEAEMACFRDAIAGKPVAQAYLSLFDGTSARSSIATAEAAMVSLRKQSWKQVGTYK
ncbi:Gfo/Idh/MocA family oxidoreductase [Paenibacillus chondroitinus]|uniref:Gfo/Idh/MocA family oxidoreductase n=1 Tax=Paenibacillus chondroitinus TaxID=59842 RepID=A0ABU6DEH8_9BACL|nr:MULTISPECIES: Gfo/Idh/MocA family oxidoreductase [Paenibacillus]MCY9656448.1 Gfo/Idh/MocA family oxidoreductase [Paenibacillus anseongense]MEB4795272.1 Gfo/Idh/MocA family oxidoreductase [Paenibacillus chondroitinus]